jgi:GT2 family glycosyltransferase
MTICEFADCGVVIPTKGDRPEFFRICLQSVLANHPGRVVIIKPKHVKIDDFGFLDEKLIVLSEESAGLAAAINQAIRNLPKEVTFVTWLGDDDILALNSIQVARNQLVDNVRAVLVYGKCAYIDQRGLKIGNSRMGKWANRLLSIGPCLVPQPGSLIRRSAFEKVGGLDASYKFAFDLDLFLKLRRCGKLVFVDYELASFRWHADSLTVSNRAQSFKESRRIRRQFVPKYFKVFNSMFELSNLVVLKLVDAYLNRIATL